MSVYNVWDKTYEFLNLVFQANSNLFKWRQQCALTCFVSIYFYFATVQGIPNDTFMAGCSYLISQKVNQQIIAFSEINCVSRRKNSLKPIIIKFFMTIMKISFCFLFVSESIDIRPTTLKILEHNFLPLKAKFSFTEEIGITIFKT